MDEMADNQQYQNFKKEIDEGMEKQQEFDNLRQQEKDFLNEIKTINDNLKKKQDEFAKEAQESSDEIIRLKKAVNETKTESELQLQYKQREIEGRFQCMERLYGME